jgi:AcrR family transcriptional regulator
MGVMGKKLSESPRRQRKRAARQEAILKTALDLVIEGGLEGLTVHRLARELDYTPGALYRYFPSKGAVLAELQRQSLESIHQALDKNIEKQLKRSDVQKLSEETRSLFLLLATATHYSKLSLDLPHHTKLISYLYGDPRQLIPAEELQRSAPAFRTLLADVDGLLNEAAKTKALKPGPARERTLLLWSSMQGVLQLEKMTGIEAISVKTSALCQQLAVSLLLGWGATQTTINDVIELIEPEK